MKKELSGVLKLMGRIIDLKAGQRFGSWTVLERAGKDKHNKALWKCVCICGEERFVLGEGLNSGSTKSCGCLKKSNLTNKRFGSLLVLKESSIKLSNKRCWNCICDCGKEIILRTSSLTSGSYKSCGCRINSILPPGEAGFREILRKYKAHARRRKLNFNLSNEQARALFIDSCYYCGERPSNVCKAQKSHFVYSGIDRLDNGRDYKIDNVVSCCVVCNYMKGTKKYKDFINQITKIYKHRKEQKI